MARQTLKFAVEMELEVPDELAARMSLQDVCDSMSCAVAVGGTSPVVINNELMPASFKWSIRGPHGDVTPEGVEVFGLPGDGFDRLEQDIDGETAPDPLVALGN